MPDPHSLSEVRSPRPFFLLFWPAAPLPGFVEEEPSSRWRDWENGRRAAATNDFSLCALGQVGDNSRSRCRSRVQWNCPNVARLLRSRWWAACITATAAALDYPHRGPSFGSVVRAAPLVRLERENKYF
jgi:hypothetical protein